LSPERGVVRVLGVGKSGDNTDAPKWPGAPAGPGSKNTAYGKGDPKERGRPCRLRPVKQEARGASANLQAHEHLRPGAHGSEPRGAGAVPSSEGNEVANRS